MVKEIKIDFSEIDRFIKILENCQNVYYDSEKDIYEFDGFEVTSAFLYETCSKFSHFINIINNTLLQKKKNIKYTYVKDTQVSLEDTIKKYGKKPRKGNKDA